MDLVIWPSPNIPLASVSHILAEDPTSVYLNNFNVEVTQIGVTNPEFLQTFAWMILEAKLRPQMHIVLLDNALTNKNNQASLFKSCACAIDFVSTHPMKYIIFYDLVNFQTGATLDSAVHLSSKLRIQTESLSSFARLHVHQGHPLHPDIAPTGLLGYDGLVKLARSIIHLTHQTLAKLND